MHKSTPFGPYRLIERIGMGGMAEIFRATMGGAQGFERELCIKRILPHCSADQDFVAMFIDEAKLAAHLNHANIVQIHAFDQIDGQYFIAMELVEGKDLRSTLRELERQGLRLGIPQSVAIAADICRGLAYAHSRQDAGQPMLLVHRDISPHNVLVSYAGEVKISDFGIAKAASRLTQTEAGTVKGKLAYMAPEQAAGQPVDHRIDQFATGLVLFEMLTGRRAYLGDSQAVVLQRALNAEVSALAEVLPEAPPALAQIVARATARDREQRYPGVSQMEEALRALLFELHPSPEQLDLAGLMQRLFCRPTGESATPRSLTEALPAVEDLPPYKEAPAGASVWATSPSQVQTQLHSEESLVGPGISNAAQPAVQPQPLAADQATRTSFVGGTPLPETGGDAPEQAASDGAGQNAICERPADWVASPESQSATAPMQRAPRLPDAAGSRRRTGLWMLGISGVGLGFLLSFWAFSPGGTDPEAPPSGLAAVSTLAAAGRGLDASVFSQAAVDANSAKRSVGDNEQHGTQIVVPEAEELDAGNVPRADVSRSVSNGEAMGRAARKGRLQLLVTDAWAVVYAGKHRLGTTPLDVELPVGRRTLRLVNPELGIEKKIKVRISPGLTEKKVISLRK